jgi:AcrR family transcriptional regulator
MPRRSAAPRLTPAAKSHARSRTQRDSGGSRWRRLPGERPGHILTAALDTFVENGFAASRLEDVAERAGISKGTLYLYFESKEALFQAVIRENIVALIERGEQLVDTYSGSSRDLLGELIRRWWGGVYHTRASALPKLILSESSNFPEVARYYFDEVVLRGRRLFGRALRRGVESGEFRALDLDYATKVIMSPIVLAMIWKHSMVKCQIEELDFNRHIDTVIDIVLHGILSGPAAGDVE